LGSPEFYRDRVGVYQAEILENQARKFWQTFGRLRLEFNQFIQREHDFSNRFGCVYGDRNDYALYEVAGDGVDTV
jgi:hypothetical protein